uniref:Uncharacterized protein n=1 Tax=Romanomermis culicivorax TaxID=13658 RepID=A0A915HKD1_ROMCU
MAKAALANHQRSCGFHQWEKLQAVLLPDYQIKIFSKERFKDLIFRVISYKRYGKEERQSVIALKWLKWL